MRGARLSIFVSTLVLAGCAAAGPHPSDSDEPVQKPRRRPEQATSAAPAQPVPPPPPPRGLEPRAVLVSHPLKGETIPPSASPESPPAAPPVVSLVDLQKRRLQCNPGDDEERLLMALLHAADGDLDAADLALSSVRSQRNPILPYLDYFLRVALGDHAEASRLLERFKHNERTATGFMIERGELCSRVRRFRDTVPAESDRVSPGGVALLYVEPRNFALKKSQGRHILHLKYDWKLFDDRSRELRVPAWESASASDREDRIAYTGPVTEFYQSFRLPLPANLAMGHYRIKVIVTDAHTGESDRVTVPIYVTAVERGS